MNTEHKDKELFLMENNSIQFRLHTITDRSLGDIENGGKISLA